MFKHVLWGLAVTAITMVVFVLIGVAFETSIQELARGAAFFTPVIFGLATYDSWEMAKIKAISRSLPND